MSQHPVNYRGKFVVPISRGATLWSGHPRLEGPKENSCGPIHHGAPLVRWSFVSECLGSGRLGLFHWEFVAAEVFVFCLCVLRLHFGHGGEGLRVVVGGVPEQESDATFGLGGFDLHLDVFGRVGLGAPVEGLQPRADDDAAPLVMSSKRSMDSPMKCAGSSPGWAMLSMPKKCDG